MRGALAIVTCGMVGSAAAGPHVVPYKPRAVCFESAIDVFQNRDFDDGGYRAELKFRYRGAAATASVPPAVGESIAKRETFKLCGIPGDARIGDSLPFELVELWRGKKLLWHESYEFPVQQKLVWSADGHDLLVEFGRAMDDVWSTPFHGAGVVPVASPPELHRLPADEILEVDVRVDERADGATLELVSVFEGGAQLWPPPVSSAAGTSSPAPRTARP